jgi:hypothetical protein
MNKIFKDIEYIKLSEDFYKINIEHTVSCILKNNVLYFDIIYSSKDIYDDRYEKEKIDLENKVKLLDIKKKALMRCYENPFWYLLYMHSKKTLIKGIFNFSEYHEKIFSELEDIIHEKSSLSSQLDVFPKYLDYFYDCQKSIVDFLIDIGYEVKFIDSNVKVFDIIPDVAEM